MTPAQLWSRIPTKWKVAGAVATGVVAAKKANDHFGLKSVSLRELYKTDATKAEALLARYYKGYEKAFPNADEREEIGTIREAAQEKGSPWDVSILTKNGRVVGGTHTNVLNADHGKVGVIEYLWVAEADRKKGLGKTAHERCVKGMQARAGGTLQGIFMEVNDPRLMSKEEIDEDSMNPWHRLSFWGDKLGYKALDAKYIQPPLDEDASAVHFLMPVYKRLDGSTKPISKDEYLSTLRAYFETWVDGDVTKQPDYQSIERSIRGSTIPLVDMGKPRASMEDQFAA